ncbi:MAG: hypothetical protein COT89_02355 [Candidatus Colwellbacteria bacterium CG10_big_fil_rev_8_21_14_0_10_42_22]|uniref:DUF3850 domain-containing protein n=1 Tax=Candidatus Colwellbacteria bacterium CG10_big_fil_rev_8_21_14_0_10_42_22 TaxID=1974540 RepID=A0A2H0VFN4_9BACT|nr:MAG: hypothetical protein COT89_02355 [Candidatus Colwellbacteria bacterium CG10_big_fil_rev_8_21_14_0_10_42_22]
MAEYKKKVWPQQFESLKSGKRKADLRLAEFEPHEGDTMILQEWNPETQEYTGRELKKKITHISKFRVDDIPFWAEQEIREKGILIISLE